MVNTPLPETNRLWTKKLKIKEVQKIILHDPGNTQTYDQVFRYFCDPNYSRVGSYHDIIEGDNVYHCIDYEYQAFHCGIFGGTNYNMAMWGEIARVGVQNRFSLGVNIIRPFEKSYGTAINHVASLCKAYKLDPYRDILCHFHIDEKKSDPVYFYKDPVSLDFFRMMVAKEMK